jgi:glutathione S-transferase
MIRLLGRKTSGNVQKVIWMLEELGLPYDREDYGRQFNNTQTEEYLRLNPNGKVPTLIDGDLVIWESNSILRYLAGREANRFYAAEPGERSEVDRWMDWQLASLNAPYLAVFKESKNPPEQRGAEFAPQAKQLGAELRILDGALSRNAWIAGRSMTIADICLGPIVHRCLNFGIELPALANIRRWHADIVERPAFKSAIAG